MSLSDEVAVAALVVSLVALIITFLQTSQAFLNTSEGYRNCRKEVIGPWAARTSRKWHWSEFRYETRWAAPEIDLMSPTQFQERATPTGSRRRGPYHLNVEAPRYATEEIYRTVQADDDSRSDLDSQVSWLQLLRELHRTYAAYRSDNIQTAVQPPPSRISNRIARRFDANSQPPSEKPIPAGESLSWRKSDPQRTDVAITYREFTWDLIPPEVVRPLAMARFGALVVLAVRLGMNWQALDPEAETMRAAGNSFSLNAVRIRGMGLLVQFREDPGKKVHHDFVPNEAADKMICGILPVCKKLVGGSDYHLVGEDRKLSFTYVQNLLTDLRVSPNVFRAVPSIESFRTRVAHGEEEHVSPLNEGLILLCPYIPLLDTSCFKIRFPCWLGGAPYATVTCHEGRVILLSGIARRVNELGSPRSSDKLSYVHHVLNRLEREFPDIWYGDCADRHDSQSSQDDGRRQDADNTRKRLVVMCSDAFEETTRFFQELSLSQEKGLSPQEEYKILVGTHISFGVRVASWMSEKKSHDAATRKPREGTGSLYLDKFGEWPVPEDARKSRRRITMSTTALADLAWSYIGRREWLFEEVRHGLGRLSMLEKMHGPQDLEIEEAWWMLMLRAVCWAISIKIDTARDAAIPSSFYDIRTPVWIT